MPRSQGALRRKLAVLRRSVFSRAAQVITPARPVLRNLAKIPFTVAAFAVGDAGAFIELHGFGYLITAMSLFLLEHMIADE
jgi:hypothetical protein